MNDQHSGLNHLNLNTSIMDRSARARGIETHVREFDPDAHHVETRYWLSFTIGEQEFYYASGMLLEAGKDRWGGIGRNLNHAAKLLVIDKFSTKQHLKSLGFSVPDGRIFRRRNLQSAIDSFKEFSGPICVKPNIGLKGKCVHTSIRDRDTFAHAIRRVAKEYAKILIEESVTGENFRFFYVHPEVVAIKVGIPMHVIGDGHSSIEELLAAKNTQRMQRRLPTHPVFELNDVALELLTSKGISPRHIPDLDEKIYLCNTANGGNGSYTIMYTPDQLHPSYLDIATRACKSIPGLYFTGMDMMIQDVTQPAAPGNHWILELNTSPSTSVFHYPWEGDSIDVSGKILEMLETSYPFHNSDAILGTFCR